MAIMGNALKERIRRKELYIVLAIGEVMMLSCGGGSTTITINGEPLVGFHNFCF